MSVFSMTLPISMKMHSSGVRWAWAMLRVTIRMVYLPRNSHRSSSTTSVPFGSSAKQGSSIRRPGITVTQT